MRGDFNELCKLLIDNGGKVWHDGQVSTLSELYAGCLYSSSGLWDLAAAACEEDAGLLSETLCCMREVQRLVRDLQIGSEREGLHCMLLHQGARQEQPALLSSERRSQLRGTRRDCLTMSRCSLSGWRTLRCQVPSPASLMISQTWSLTGRSTLPRSSSWTSLVRHVYKAGAAL